MRRIRVIPVLLLQNRQLIKTTRFKDFNYVGDCINALKIFNEKGVDEIVVLDIIASRNGQPDFDYINLLINECFMPLAYGGGISNIEQASTLLSMGVEKIILGASAFYKPELIKTLSDKFGSQSVVISVDVKQDWLKRTRVYIENGGKNTGFDPIVFAKKMDSLGAGELIVQSIDRDGTNGGYGLDLIKRISSAVNIPVVALGGANTINDFVSAVREGASAVAAGSMFVFKGPHKAVLINYPSQAELNEKFYKSVSLH